jgi:hypothetical protein
MSFWNGFDDDDEVKDFWNASDDDVYVDLCPYNPTV